MKVGYEGYTLHVHVFLMLMFIIPRLLNIDVTTAHRPKGVWNSHGNGQEQITIESSQLYMCISDLITNGKCITLSPCFRKPCMLCLYYYVNADAFYSVLRPFQDYFSSYEKGQSVGWAKTGVPREKKHLTHPRAELGLSHMWPELGSNPHQSQR